MTLTACGPTLYVDLSNLCRDHRLLPAGVDADLGVFDRFRLAVEQHESIAVTRTHCVADRSLLPMLPPAQRRVARDMEVAGTLDFSAVADERLLSLAFDDDTPGLVASMDFFDDFRRSFPEIQGSTDRFVGWEPQPGGGLHVAVRDMQIHSHHRLSRKEESAELKARRLRRESIVQRAAGHRYRCADTTCLVAQLWPDQIPDLPRYDDAVDRFVCASCEGELEVGATRPHAHQLIVFLDGVEKTRVMVDVNSDLVIGRSPGSDCFGLQATLGTNATQAVSRRHVRFAARSDGLFVEDLGSRNGSVLRSGSTERSLADAGCVAMRRLDVVALPAGITIERSGRSFPHDAGEQSERVQAMATDCATRLIGATQR